MYALNDLISNLTPATGLKIVGTGACLPWCSISSSFQNSLKMSGHRRYAFLEFWLEFGPILHITVLKRWQIIFTHNCCPAAKHEGSCFLDQTWLSATWMHQWCMMRYFRKKNYPARKIAWKRIMSVPSQWAFMDFIRFYTCAVRQI